MIVAGVGHHPVVAPMVPAPAVNAAGLAGALIAQQGEQQVARAAELRELNAQVVAVEGMRRAVDGARAVEAEVHGAAVAALQANAPAQQQAAAAAQQAAQRERDEQERLRRAQVAERATQQAAVYVAPPPEPPRRHGFVHKMFHSRH